MKKIINAPENYVDEMLEGIYVAHPDLVTYVADDLRCLVTANKKEGKVGIATGGGSGHLPLFLGYVGRGMLDGCCVGDVFQSPSSEQMLAVTKAIDSGAGVLYIYGNYNGDIFNFNMAAEMAEFEEGIRVETVLGADDVASGPLPAEGEKSIRRGVAGIFFVYKCAGAAADRMMSLDDVKRVAEKATASVRTMGVALTPCIVPRVGHPGFSIGDDEMEIGMGIHGETGIRRGKLEPADQIVEEMMEKILADFDEIDGSRVAVLVNGLGATTLDEQYIVTRKIDSILKSRNITVKRYYVGEYATALEMAGVSISVLKLDEELESLLEEPAQTPFFHQGSVSEEGTVKMDVKKAAGTAAEGSAEEKNGEDVNSLVEFLKKVSEIMAEHKDYLIDLDSVVGDGDLGLTMSDGFAAAYKAVHGTGETDSGKLLYTAGKAMSIAVPSTMGTLMASGLMQAGKKLRGKTETGLAESVELFEGYAEGVMALGKAKVGDKTFLDGMVPAVEALKAAQAAGKDLNAAAKDAKEAAQKGFENTTSMIAVHGRAATRGEASRSLKDPGAAVAMLIMDAFEQSL
ncbi:dihydroxyacetone kinase family protein [Fusibacillus kribbianus]|uniref:Dihydroxyacetone kinase family protein n=1 Tax=Fusibacillus kribbianus TaxID=3044208 RepID=A0AAP4B8B3_9FIRM|nr:dihydroxyacetone kinase family protein [Ruminococcus sp. YH-rum2234]MDI9241490.1 dihydroxyacetone kinase family protein [Ruminococcus sp. YH-rum2234]